jgi:hypothetical protein
MESEREWSPFQQRYVGHDLSDFAKATLVQIQNASRLPIGGISEMSTNAALAFIEGAKPKNEIEAALAFSDGLHASERKSFVSKRWR